MIFRGLLAGVLMLVVGTLSWQRGFFPADRLLGVAPRQLGGPAPWSRVKGQVRKAGR